MHIEFHDTLSNCNIRIYYATVIALAGAELDPSEDKSRVQTKKNLKWCQVEENCRRTLKPLIAIHLETKQKKKKEEETERKSENISEWSHQSTSAGTSNYVFMTCVASLSGHKKYAESLKIEKRISSSSDFIIEPSSDHHRGRG